MYSLRPWLSANCPGEVKEKETQWRNTLCDICCCSLCAVSHSCSVFLTLLVFICFLNAPLKSGTYAGTSPARDGSSNQKSGASGHPVMIPFKLHPAPLVEFKTKADLCSLVLCHRLAFFNSVSKRFISISYDLSETVETIYLFLAVWPATTTHQQNFLCDHSQNSSWESVTRVVRCDMCHKLVPSWGSQMIQRKVVIGSDFLIFDVILLCGSWVISTSSVQSTGSFISR